jgi:hypothetical protein
VFDAVHLKDFDECFFRSHFHKNSPFFPFWNWI